MPSLQQLDDAVRAYIEVEPEALITVVVDATFGHRIDDKEVEAFDAAVANNEIVAPPAGAVGRGDAFVLSIADKVGASILTNDSYQEFHGQYAWLFDEGRIVGGKPVPHIGWVFVNRTPVRGPLSRKSIAESKRKGGGRRSNGSGDRPGASQARMGSPEASQPMPVPTKPPPGLGRRRDTDDVTAAVDAARAESSGESTADAPTDGRRRNGRGGRRSSGETAQGREQDTSTGVTARSEPSRGEPARGEPVNDLLAFLDFVAVHPPGSSVSAAVDTYSSHGAYVMVGDVRCYVPLRLMADPAPRSAREFMKVGESVTLVVDSFVAGRRSIDLAVPGMQTATAVDAVAEAVRPADGKTAAKKAAAQKRAPTKAASKTVAAPVEKAVAKKAVAKKAVAKKAVAKKAVVKKAVAEKAAGPLDTTALGTEPKKAAPRKAAPEKAAAPAKKPVAKKAAEPLDEAAAKKPVAKKASAAGAAAKKAEPTKKAASRKAVAPVQEAAPKKAAPRKAEPTKKAASKKAVASVKKAASARSTVARSRSATPPRDG